jgi:hypothetical protein
VSINASNWVWSLKLGDATRKLVLLRFADHAHDDGTAAWCGIKKVADFAECSDRTVKRHIAHLVEHGYMREGDQSLVDHIEARYRPIVYELAMNEPTREQWAVFNAAGGNARREAASAAGKKGPEAKAAAKAAANDQVSRGDSVTPLAITSNGPDVRGDDLSPLGRGDTEDGSGVTDEAFRGDTGVTQTTQQTTQGTTPTTSSSEDLRSSDAEIDTKFDDRFSDAIKARWADRDITAVCEHLQQAIVANGCKRPTITNRWRDEARKLIDLDKRTEAQVHNMIDWATKDTFWASNILSMPTLREKYDQMRMRALEEANKAAKPAPGRSGYRDDSWGDRHAGPTEDDLRAIAELTGKPYEPPATGTHG